MDAALVLEAVDLASKLYKAVAGSALADDAIKLLGILYRSWGATGKTPDEFAAMVAKWTGETAAQWALDKAVMDEEAKGPKA